jgi:hypothetical protein
MPLPNPDAEVGVILPGSASEAAATEGAGIKHPSEAAGVEPSEGPGVEPSEAAQSRPVFSSRARSGT